MYDVVGGGGEWVIGWWAWGDVENERTDTANHKHLTLTDVCSTGRDAWKRIDGEVAAAFCELRVN